MPRQPRTIPYPVYFKSGTSFFLFKDKQKCLMVHFDESTDRVEISEENTNDWIYHATFMGHIIKQKEFAEALLKATIQIESYYSKEDRKAFAAVTVFDPMIENTLYETQNA